MLAIQHIRCDVVSRGVWSSLAGDCLEPVLWILNTDAQWPQPPKCYLHFLTVIDGSSSTQRLREILTQLAHSLRAKGRSTSASALSIQCLLRPKREANRWAGPGVARV